jgi:hypothetical protein
MGWAHEIRRGQIYSEKDESHFIEPMLLAGAGARSHPLRHRIYDLRRVARHAASRRGSDIGQKPILFSAAYRVIQRASGVFMVCWS